MNSHNQLNIVKDKRSSMITDKYNTLTEVFSNQLSLQKESSNDSEKKKKISNEDIIQAFIKTISIFIGEDDIDVTLQGLNVSIKRASEFLFSKINQDHLISEGRSTITLKAVSEIIIHLINKHISKNLRENFSFIKHSVVRLCDDLLALNENSKNNISKFFKGSMRNGMTLLVHGFSTTVFYAVRECKRSGINLNVLISDCSPEHSGNLMKNALRDEGIKCDVILDLSIGYHMNNVDCVIVGSNAIVENGGVINRIGTYTLALVAKNFKKPFYVLSETLKFLKLYPLDQNDIPFNNKSLNSNNDETNNNHDNHKEYICDYTPPEFISLVFTDTGIFTPSSISDEIIQMFYN